jgi:general secretion pathway protein I
LRHTGRGFTLIEVLVALAIVTMGVAAVLGALTSSANTVLYLRDKTFAQWVGLNQIANIRLSGQVQQPGNTSGDTDFAGRSWHWRQEVTATEIPGVVRIDIKVRPKEIKADDDSGWFTTVSGIQGDAVGVANGYLPSWGTQTLGGITTGVPGSTSNPTGLGARGGIGSLGSGTLGTQGTLGTGGVPSQPGNQGLGNQGLGNQGLIMPTPPPQSDTPSEPQ